MPHRIHCILIDDDPAVLSPMQNILHQSAQFHVDKCFTSIDNALAYLQTHQPDLIISDIEFPQQDLAYYRLKEFPDDIPLCLISGYPVYVAQSYPFCETKPRPSASSQNPSPRHSCKYWKHSTTNTSSAKKDSSKTATRQNN